MYSRSPAGRPRDASIRGSSPSWLVTTPMVASVARIKHKTELPVAVGFGVRTAEQARVIGEAADGVVVGSALVSAIAGTLDASNRATSATAGAVEALVKELARGVRSVRKKPVAA